MFEYFKIAIKVLNFSLANCPIAKHFLVEKRSSLIIDDELSNIKKQSISNEPRALSSEA
jgi:hypothetical protein